MRNRELFDSKQANQYLIGTLIRYQDLPVIVMSVIGKNYKWDYGLQSLNNIQEAKIEQVAWDDPNIDMTPVPLGFMSVNEDSKIKGTVYMARTPIRRMHIGLCRENLALEDIPRFTIKITYSVAFRDILTSKNMLDTILGRYPTVAQAIELSNKNKQPIAFSRRFAVMKNLLFYKYAPTEVGDISNTKVTLSDEYLYLKEVLDEDLK